MFRPDDLTSASPARHLPTELLRQYVGGELSMAQEHAVEAHTLECEQCADILEGLEMQPAAVTDASLHELRQRLHTRVAELAADEPTKLVVRPLWWRFMEAAAILLLTLGAVAWLVLRPSARPEIAVRTVPTAEKLRSTAPSADLDGTVVVPEPAPVRQDLIAVAPPEAPINPPPVYPPITDSRVETEATRPVSAEIAQAGTADAVAPAESASVASAAEGPSALPPAPQASYATTMDAPTADKLSTSRRSAEPGETARTTRPVAATAKTGATLGANMATEAGRTVRGRIVDNSGLPVPGATVLVPGSGTGVSTSADGWFAVSVPPGSRQLTVSSIGYTSQTRFLQATDSTLTLALVPDSKQLSEVVIVRREAPPSLPSMGPVPAGGLPAFRQYLRDSLDYPEKARNQKLQGTVRLQFVVGTDGKISDIKIMRRLSPECDEEAIRLLKEGPTWFPGVQNNRRTARKVEISVPFSLEKL